MQHPLHGSEGIIMDYSYYLSRIANSLEWIVWILLFTAIINAFDLGKKN